MADPIIWLPAEKRYKYPHMAPNDVSMWEKFLDNHIQELNEVAYDVRVGIGQDPGETFEPNIREMAIKLTQYRIDVLNKGTRHYDIIEVKRDPGPGAVGQLLSYFDLFIRSYPELTPVKLILICNRTTPDLVTVLNSYNIDYFIV